MTTTLNRLMIVTCCTCLAFIAGHLHGRADMVEKQTHDLYVTAVKQLRTRAEQAEARAADEKSLRMEERSALITHLQEKDRAHQAADRLIADLRADTRRLRIPTRVPACPAAVPGGSTEPGTGDEGHAELTPDAGAFLVSLLKRGDAAILKHAAVVDSYNRLATACRKELPHATP